MNQPKKFEVLRELKILLKYLNLYHKSDWCSGGLNFLKPLTYLVLSIPILIYLVVPFRVCLFYEFDLKIIATPLMVTLGTSQGVFMFWSFACKSSLIMETADLLQQLVQRSIY